MNIVFYCIFIGSFLFSNALIYNDIQSTLIKAKNEKKLIYLLIWEDGCPWCYAMKKKVLKDKIVQEAINGKYIIIMANKDLDYIPKKFQTYFYPTSFIVNPNDNNYIAQKFLGYISAKPLSSALQETFEMLK